MSNRAGGGFQLQPREAGDPIFKGVLVHDLTKMRLAAALRRDGHSFSDAHQLAAQLTGPVIEEGIRQTLATDPTLQATVAALPWDGSLFQKFLDFLNSPLGKMLIDLLKSWLGL